MSAARRATAGLLLLGLLTACSSGERTDTYPSAGEAPSSASATDEPVATDGPRPTSAEVVLSTVAWNDETAAVEAAGYLSPVVEDGGTCTLELTRGDETRTVEVPGLSDATTTMCAGLAVAGDQLQPGEWEAVLRYRSEGTKGSSGPQRVEVP